jgi:hypothetical protein
MAKKNRVLFINGTITIDPSGTPDLTTLADASAVVLAMENENLFFAGAHPSNVEMHTVKFKGRLVLKNVPFRKETLEKILGLTTAAGTLADGVTVSQNSKATLAAGFQKPEIEVLIKGTDDATGARVEIYAAKAVVTNNLEIPVSSSEFFQQDIELECLGNEASTSTAVFEIREETISAVSEPVFTSVFPASGAAAGGTSITILGANFEANPVVTVGGVAATGEVAVSSGAITCVTGAHAAGAVDIVITNADTGTVTAVAAFTYV